AFDTHASDIGPHTLRERIAHRWGRRRRRQHERLLAWMREWCQLGPLVGGPVEHLALDFPGGEREAESRQQHARASHVRDLLAGPRTQGRAILPRSPPER